MHREFHEELGVELTAAEPLAITENHFEVGGVVGHEVVHVFAVRSPGLDALALDAELRGARQPHHRPMAFPRGAARRRIHRSIRTA